MGYKHFCRLLLLWLIIGMAYFTLEGLWRICSNGGWANIVMMPIGGLCGVFVGAINQVQPFKRMKIVWQSLLGTVIVLIVELVTGLIVNKWLGMNVWDYSNLPFNIAGQICLLYSVLWFLLMPFAIWFDDTLRYFLWHEGLPYGLISSYRRLITYQ